MAEEAPQKSSLENLVDLLIASGVRDLLNEKEAILDLYTKPRQKVVPRFPCPKFDRLVPPFFTAGIPMDLYFYPDGLGVTYTIAIIDISVSPSTSTTINVIATNPPSPFKVTIPGGNFLAGHEYTIVLYPTLAGIPYGCSTYVPITSSTSSDFRKAVVAALALVPQTAS
jgi:hypothetical protein